MLVLVAFWPAWSNGANDSFKGVATLYRSGTATLRTSRLWVIVIAIFPVAKV